MNSKKKIKPNTILIGAQKCATTSVYNWVSQHPEVCGPSTLKDYSFFIKDSFFEKGIDLFKKDYEKEGYNNQKIILHGCVHYIYFKKAIDRIYEYDPNIKLLLVLRNPIDRAISAYQYAKKMNLEKLEFKSALKKENTRLKGNLSDRSELTYVSHSKYGEQLEYLLQKFDRSQLCVIFYDDVNNRPESVTQKIFNFLDVDLNFTPSFSVLNRTGKLKFKALQKVVYSQNKYKKGIVKYVLDPILPLSKRIKIKNRFKEWNTKNNKVKEDFSEYKMLLKPLFVDDINKTEKILNLDLSHWK